MGLRLPTAQGPPLGIDGLAHFALGLGHDQGFQIGRRRGAGRLGQGLRPYPPSGDFFARRFGYLPPLRSDRFFLQKRASPFLLSIAQKKAAR